MSLPNCAGMPRVGLDLLRKGLNGLRLCWAVPNRCAVQRPCCEVPFPQPHRSARHCNAGTGIMLRLQLGVDMERSSSLGQMANARPGPFAEVHASIVASDRLEASNAGIQHAASAAASLEVRRCIWA